MSDEKTCSGGDAHCQGSSTTPPDPPQRIEPGCVKGGCNDCGLCGMRSPRANKRKPTLSANDKKKMQNLVPGIDLK